MNKTTESYLSTHKIILDTVPGWCIGKIKWLKNYGLILCELNASAIQNAVAYESEKAQQGILKLPQILKRLKAAYRVVVLSCKAGRKMGLPQFWDGGFKTASKY